MTKKEKALVAFAIFALFCLLVLAGDPPLLAWARVDGNSMETTFSDGDLLIFHHARYKVGDVVYAEWEDCMLVKRVVSIDGDAIHITGDNVEEAYDYVVTPWDIGGKLVCRIWRGK